MGVSRASSPRSRDTNLHMQALYGGRLVWRASSPRPTAANLAKRASRFQPLPRWRWRAAARRRPPSRSHPVPCTELLNSCDTPHILQVPMLVGPFGWSIIQWCMQLVSAAAVSSLTCRQSFCWLACRVSALTPAARLGRTRRPSGRCREGAGGAGCCSRTARSPAPSSRGRAPWRRWR